MVFRGAGAGQSTQQANANGDLGAPRAAAGAAAGTLEPAMKTVTTQAMAEEHRKNAAGPAPVAGVLALPSRNIDQAASVAGELALPGRSIGQNTIRNQTTAAGVLLPCSV